LNCELESLPGRLDDVWDKLVEGDRVLDLLKRAWRAVSGRAES